MAMQSQFVVSQALALGNWQLYKKEISRDLKLKALKEKKMINLYGFLVMNNYNYD